MEYQFYLRFFKARWNDCFQYHVALTILPIKKRFQEHIVSRIVMNRDIISLKINIIGFKFLRHLEKYKRSEKKTHFLLRLICLFFPFFSWWAGYLRGKLERPLTSSRVNHWEITLYWSFFKLVKDMREKSRENNGDEIAVLFPEGHEAIQITY